jgi:hypothetical protein
VFAADLAVVFPNSHSRKKHILTLSRKEEREGGQKE